MNQAYIYDAVRTPRGKGKPDGSLHTVTPVQLVVTLLHALRERHKFDTELVEDVILGCVTQMKEQGANIAKTAAQAAAYSDNVAGFTLNRFCASGLEAINTAAAHICSGMSELIIAGGVESMSRVTMGIDGGAWYTDPMVATPGYFIPQGVSADLIATKFGFSRRDVDEFAAESHRRAAHAQLNQYFEHSLIAVADVNNLNLLERDEMVRANTTVDTLAALSPSFETMGRIAGFDGVALQRYPEIEQIKHVHHAGNSSSIVDGASAVLVGSKNVGDILGMKPRAVIRSYAVLGTEPTIMLLGPAPASELALKRAGLQVNDIDLFEVNEAFAAVVLRFMQALNVPHDKVNVNGGAIAMGHPLGATGGILMGTVLDELERRDLQFGLCTLCVGGGMGIATIVERI